MCHNTIALTTSQEGAELVFLPFSIALATLHAVSVEDVPCKGSAAFYAA